MVGTKDKDESSKSKLSSEKSVALAQSSILSNVEEDEEEYEEEEEDDEEVEYEEDDDDESEEEEQEQEEKVNKEETNKENAVKEVEKKAKEPKNGENSVKEVEKKAKEPKNGENAVKEVEKKAKEPKNGEELGEKSKSKEKTPRSRDKSTKKTVANGDKPESSRRKRGSKRVESMGMVFMCSSKTKTDCFRYKVLGLPASKQDQVAKIYKGMRLFLFDVDLRLMYGIFKAAGPGGYNLEPKAFKSEFPSQVRFTVMDDCLPVAEEKFKEHLKENYYTRNKFEGLLKADQVKKLCKLFAVTSKGPLRSKRRIRIGERRIRDREDESRDRKKRRIRARDEERRFPPRPRSRSRSRSRSPSRREKRRYSDYERPPVMYERAAPVVRYLTPPPHPVVSPARSYPYDRPPPFDRVPDHRAYHEEIRSLDWDREMHRDRERDPYYVYSREAPTVYALPTEYHIVSREYHHPPPVQPLPPPEYRFSHRTPPEYRDVGPPPEYRSHRTHYRY